MTYDVTGGGMNNRSGYGAQSRPPADERKDFDDSANPLWSLYGKEAKSRDEARIQALKDDMDGVLIFVWASFPPRGRPS